MTAALASHAAALGSHSLTNLERHKKEVAVLQVLPTTPPPMRETFHATVRVSTFF